MAADGTRIRAAEFPVWLNRLVTVGLQPPIYLIIIPDFKLGWKCVWKCSSEIPAHMCLAEVGLEGRSCYYLCSIN